MKFNRPIAVKPEMSRAWDLFSSVISVIVLLVSLAIIVAVGYRLFVWIWP